MWRRILRKVPQNSRTRFEHPARKRAKCLIMVGARGFVPPPTCTPCGSGFDNGYLINHLCSIVRCHNAQLCLTVHNE